MDYSKILSLVILVGYLQGFTILFISIYSKRIRIRAYLYLNLLVLSLSLNNLQAWIMNNDFSFHSYYLDNHFTSWYIFLAPLFYLFIAEYITAKFRKWIVGFSVTFFIVISVAKTVVLYIYRQKEISFVKDQLFQLNKFSELIGIIFTVGVVYYIYRFIKQEDNQKTLKRYENLNWLDSFLKISFTIILTWMIALLIRAFYDKDSQFVYNILRVSITVLIYWITYKAMYTEKQLTKRSLGNRKRSFSNQQDDADYEILAQHIETTELFLNPLLKIEDVSKEIAISKSKISFLIKKNAQTNFVSYINAFRVKEAKKLLTDPTYSHYTLDTIGLESGFNSNSAFYTHFKKFTGKTPKQWQAEHAK